MSQPGKPCIFCGGYGHKTKQHVVPNRIKKLVPRLNPGHVEQRDRYEYQNEGTQLLRTEPFSRKHQGHLGSKQLRVVCDDCNTGWLKAAETAAFEYVEPMVLGGPTILDLSAQRALTLQAATIFALIDYLDKRAHVITFEDRKRMKETGTPPGDWHFFLGRCDDPAWAYRYQRHAAVSLPKRMIGADNKTNVQVVTLTLGNLALQLVMAQGFMVLRNPDRYANLVRMVKFPRVETINTSLLPVLSGGELATLASALVTMRWMVD